MKGGMRQVDLTNCADEPIHVPGAVQSLACAGAGAVTVDGSETEVTRMVRERMTQSYGRGRRGASRVLPAFRAIFAPQIEWSAARKS